MRITIQRWLMVARSWRLIENFTERLVVLHNDFYSNTRRTEFADSSAAYHSRRETDAPGALAALKQREYERGVLIDQVQVGLPTRR